MKNKIILILNILVILFCGTLVVLYLTDTYEIPEKNFAKAALLFFTYLIAVIRYTLKGTNRRKEYRNEYAYLIRDAFANDKKSLNKLMDCIVLYNDDKYTKAIKGLEQLLPACIGFYDKSAVLFFLALCHSDSHNYARAIEYYEQLLSVDVMHSTAWSNLGFLYEKTSRTDKAKEAYQQALLYDPENATAYNNMGNYFYRNGEFELAKEYGLKAFQLNNKLSQAASLLALTYAALGNAERADKYCRIYASHGNDPKKLSALIENHLQNQ